MELIGIRGRATKWGQPDPYVATPNREVVDRRTLIEHIIWGRRAAWSPLWWWPCVRLTQLLQELRDWNLYQYFCCFILDAVSIGVAFHSNPFPWRPKKPRIRINPTPVSYKCGLAYSSNCFLISHHFLVIRDFLCNRIYYLEPLNLGVFTIKSR